MKPITDTWRHLVRRRLWPVAVLLVAALVAVPKLLAKTPEPVAPPAANAQAAAASEQAAAEPVVALVDDTSTTRRRVLGAQKDPFEPKALPKVKKTAKKSAKTAAAPKAKAVATATPSAPSTPATGTAPVTPVATATPTPAPTYPLYSIKVNFGRTDAEATSSQTVKRLGVLPSVETPVLVYRGVEDGGKVAVFELTGDVIAQGDGVCDPSPTDCQILKLKVGDTEFLDITGTGEDTDAQYELDLTAIRTKTTKSSSDLAKASTAGRALLGALGAKSTARYAYDPKTGTLHKLSAKVAKKLTAAARRASL
jgi:hypothetical protein